ncbi:hypothetical protein SEA_HIRKO_69 [Arthrobacter phage Hirko]|nr:hypothetical protein SEA_HIRKO_69 [Arthrobacter phage Hirko]
MTKELIDATLAQHHTWGVKITKNLMTCKGCDWTRKPVPGESNPEAFRRHQAEQVAAVLAEQPAEQPAPAPPAARDDLTVFAALIARLGGETTVSWEEARRLSGVTVTRWDEPAHMRYRFTLGAPEFETPADLGVMPGRVALQMPDGSYKTADEIRVEAAAMTDPVILHAERRHPAWEYATTEGPRKAWNDADTPPDGDGWERNTAAGRSGWDRFDYTEESYWRRLKAPTPPHHCEPADMHYLGDGTGARFCATCGKDQ